MGAQSFHVGGQTDIMKLIATFSNFTIAPKKYYSAHTVYVCFLFVDLKKKKIRDFCPTRILVTGFTREVECISCAVRTEPFSMIRVSPRSFNVGFVVDKVALGQVPLRIPLFPPVCIFPLTLHTRLQLCVAPT